MKRKIIVFCFFNILLSTINSQEIIYNISKGKYEFFNDLIYNYEEFPKDEQGVPIDSDKTLFYKIGDDFSCHSLEVDDSKNYFLHGITVRDEVGEEHIFLIDDLDREGVNKRLHKTINGVWISSYYYDILKDNNKNSLFLYEPFWKIDWKTSVGEDWEDDYFPIHLLISDNYFYISSYATGYRFYLIVSDYKDGGLKCYTLKKYIDNGIIDSQKEILGKFDGENEISIFFERDGDYLTIYNDSLKQNKIATFVYIQDYYTLLKQLRNVINENSVNFDEITWPRHADGTSDYDDEIKPPMVKLSDDDPISEVEEDSAFLEQIVDANDTEIPDEESPATTSVNQKPTNLPLVIHLAATSILVIGVIIVVVVVRKKRRK